MTVLARQSVGIKDIAQTSADATLNGSSLGTDIFVLADSQCRVLGPFVPPSFGASALRNSAMVQGLKFMAESRQSAISHGHWCNTLHQNTPKLTTKTSKYSNRLTPQRKTTSQTQRQEHKGTRAVDAGRLFKATHGFLYVGPEIMRSRQLANLAGFRNPSFGLCILFWAAD